MHRHFLASMRRHLALGMAVLFASLSPAAAFADTQRGTVSQYQVLSAGVPVLAGTITSPSAARTNATTAAPFTLAGAQMVDIQCDIAVYVYVPATATSANGVLVPANTYPPYRVTLRPGDTTVSIIAVATATSACKVWAMQ